ncbi:MAG: PIN domain-containing protein [Myxococcales bacterium]|nr:PIN domain-containing protein [Myxococcales bacterium]
MYLLDTNVLSEVIKREPSAVLMARLAEAPADELFTTSITVMELRYGAARRPDRRKFWARLEEEVLSRVRVLGFGPGEAEQAGDLLAELVKRGVPIGLEDTLIAAVALAHRLALVTRNVRHFERVPLLEVENWFEAA